VFILPIALAVLGFAHLHLSVAKTQIIDRSGQSYYVNARPLLDYPLPDLLRAAPELQGLEPTRNQDELAFILHKAGKVTEDLLGRMPDLISREDVTQQKLRGSGSVRDQRRDEFDYMILAHRQGETVTLDEYRAGPDGSPLEARGLEEGYMLTRGFASAWLHFLPPIQSAARFRYLGQQTHSGLRCYVVAFAQKPGSATVTGTVVYEGISVRILYQGIAWIDETSFRIVRLRTDLLAPRPDIGLERQTTELHFSETRLPQTDSPLWLPQEVVVTTDMNNQFFRNVHRYSGYRLFKVETKILPGPPDQPPPKRPN
jgi:hypothetical protein